MFETAELGHEVDKATYDVQAAEVRAALLDAQRELARADVSVVVIVTGVGGAGKSETVNLLLEWLDARGIKTHAMRKPSAEERRRPPMWRYRGSTCPLEGGWRSSSARGTPSRSSTTSSGGSTASNSTSRSTGSSSWSRC